MSTLLTTNLKNPSSGSNNIVLDSSGNITLGTAKVTAITDSAGNNSSTPEAIANGTAKAWVNFNGTGAVAIRASYNVSSITDNGVGDYTINFTTAFANTNYALSAFTIRTNGGDCIVSAGASISFQVGSVRVGTRSGSGTLNDSEHVHVSVFR